VAAGGLERYAELRWPAGEHLPLGAGEVALGVQGAALLGATPGDTVTIVLADGSTLSRQVSATYERGLGFGEVLLPLAELQRATASGLPPAVAVTVADDATAEDVAARIRLLTAGQPGLEVTRSPVLAAPSAATGEATFQILLLAILFGYIAITVVNSLVTATLAQRSRLALLRLVGATPAQLRRLPRAEAMFVATTACVAGTLAALPGLSGMAYSLSNHERIVPAIGPVAYAVIVTLTFALVAGATALPARSI
jgi:putative ABC transport system permease protein